ncbi:MAG: TetR/AcrR family transcriptional regulator [Thermodesulfobacteriota bacterium]
MERKYKRKRNRLVILQAAEKLFSENAYSSITMDQVAIEAGITRRTLYAYFPSKLTLFIKMFEENIQQLNDEVIRVCAERNDPAQMINKLFNSLFEHTNNSLKYHLVFWMLDSNEFEGELPEELVQRIKLWTRAIIDNVLEVAQKLQAEGVLRLVDAETLIHLISAVNKGIFIHTRKERRFNIADIYPEKLKELFLEILQLSLIIDPSSKM